MTHPYKGTITKLGMNKCILDNLSLLNAHEGLTPLPRHAISACFFCIQGVPKCVLKLSLLSNFFFLTRAIRDKIISNIYRIIITFITQKQMPLIRIRL